MSDNQEHKKHNVPHSSNKEEKHEKIYRQVTQVIQNNIQNFTIKCKFCIFEFLDTESYQEHLAERHLDKIQNKQDEAQKQKEKE